MFILTSIRTIAVPYWKANREASADTFGFLEERLAGTEDIRSNDAKPYVMRRFHELIAELVPEGPKSRPHEQHHVQHYDVHVRRRQRHIPVPGGVSLLRRLDYPRRRLPDLPLHPDARDAHQSLHAAARQLPAGHRLHRTHRRARQRPEDHPRSARPGPRCSTRRRLPLCPVRRCHLRLQRRACPPQRLTRPQTGPSPGTARPHRQRQDYHDPASLPSLRPDLRRRSSRRRGHPSNAHRSTAPAHLHGHAGRPPLPRHGAREPHLLR